MIRKNSNYEYYKGIADKVGSMMVSLSGDCYAGDEMAELIMQTISVAYEEGHKLGTVEEKVRMEEMQKYMKKQEQLEASYYD